MFKVDMDGVLTVIALGKEGEEGEEGEGCHNA